MSRPRYHLLTAAVALFFAFSASADALSDLRGVLRRYPARSRFAAAASVRVSGKSADAGARAGSAAFQVDFESGAMVLRTPPAVLAAATAEAQRKRIDADSPTPTRNAMVAVTIFDVADALDIGAMLLNELEGATMVDATPSSLAGKPVTLLRIKVKPDLAGTRSRLVDEPVIDLRVWVNGDGIPVKAERDSRYSASVLFVSAANLRNERWEIAVAGDRLYATRAEQSNRASAAGKTLASSRSMVFEVTR